MVTSTILFPFSQCLIEPFFMTSPLANDMRVRLSVGTVAFLSDRVLVSLGGFQQVDQRHASVVLSGQLRVSIRFHGVQER